MDSFADWSLPRARGDAGGKIAKLPLLTRIGSLSHDAHALGTTLSRTGLFHMETLTQSQFREFAEQCDRLAAQVTTERHRIILKEMAEAWRKLALAAEAGALPVVSRPPGSSETAH
jgi:hypothetical protein